jgi:hypothetical protein
VSDSDPPSPSESLGASSGEQTPAEAIDELTDMAEGGADEAAAESSPSTSTPREMLLSTEPDPPLSQVESPWQPKEGGPSRLKRAAMKAGDVDGLPAALDLILGLVETATKFMDERDTDQGGAGDDDQDGADEGGDDDPLAGAGV